MNTIENMYMLRKDIIGKFDCISFLPFFKLAIFFFCATAPLHLRLIILPQQAYCMNKPYLSLLAFAPPCRIVNAFHRYTLSKVRLTMFEIVQNFEILNFCFKIEMQQLVRLTKPACICKKVVLSIKWNSR